MKNWFEKDWEIGAIVAVSLVVGYAIYRILKFFLKRYLEKQTERLNSTSTHYYFLYNSLGFICILISVIVIFLNIPELKEVGMGLLTSAGIFAAILGFASQAAFSNIVSGIFIVFFKPFRVGDILKIEPNNLGEIEDITLRHTVLRDFENKRFIIPNSLISSQVLHNYSITDERIASLMVFGVAYDADVDLAMEIIKEEAMKHPFTIDNRTKIEIEEGREIVDVRMVEWADSAVKIRLKVWAWDAENAFLQKTELWKLVFDRFKAEKIEIPYPHHTVIMKQPV
jgi:small-conductance mechanosensitive channel